MRIGIRSAISALVLTSIVVSAVGVHLLWWRTAQQVSQTLADTINDQIVSAVGDELQSITTEARSSMMAVRTLLGRKSIRGARRQKARIRVPFAVAVAADNFLGGVRMAGRIVLRRAQARRYRDRNARDHGGDRKLRIDRYEFEGNDLKLKASRVEDTHLRRHRSGMVSRSDPAPTTNTGRR